jgi:hypothetical protein
MKIWYKTLSRIAHVEESLLLERIVETLKGKGYDIILQTDNCVQFKYGFWRPGSRTAAFSFLNGGRFEIIDETKTIMLSYYLSPIYEVVLCCLSAVLAVFVLPQVFYLFILFLIMFGIRASVIIDTANSLLDRILNGNTK